MTEDFLDKTIVQLQLNCQVCEWKLLPTHLSLNNLCGEWGESEV